ncbi:uncharacterized protein LODBEIA_P02810 [Lodderomyces beijingensis]|uniref:HTH La-type RNA-binding domain-containing protein n=1 Tax=Lodderomyces beijingensis TaxID=1775926 RepID=A0ABP0ZD08_9ASCO
MTDFVYQGEDFDERVRKQVEFYFSDSNLQQDKFLWKIYESNDGWVELKTILTFGRMKQYRPEEKVVDALKQSEKLLLSANNEMIKRKDPLKDFNEVKNNKKKNTVHIEGFPHTLTQDQVEKWFTEKVVPFLPKQKELCSIRMIKTRAKKEFFGVVDVEFHTEEDAQYLINDVELSYDNGVISKEEAENLDKKQLLKKMSQLTFQEMRENGKRFGQNEVTKRRNSFNENKGKKHQKGNKGKKFENNNRKKSEDQNNDAAAAGGEKAQGLEKVAETTGEEGEQTNEQKDEKSSTEEGNVASADKTEPAAADDKPQTKADGLPTEVSSTKKDVEADA